MARVRRGGWVLVMGTGDHSPRHVHDYRDRRLIVKWDLENCKPMSGSATRRIQSLIQELESEGLL